MVRQDGRFLASFGYGASLVAALYLLARGYRAPDAWTGEKELKIRALLQQYGANDSLSHFATRRDKQVIFSRIRGRRLRTVRWVRCVWRRATGWVTLIRGMPPLSSGCCRRVAMVGFPAALSVSEAGARLITGRACRLFRWVRRRSLEADRFTLNDTSMLPVRQAVQRASRRVQAQMRRFAELDEQQRQQVAGEYFGVASRACGARVSMALNRVE